MRASAVRLTVQPEGDDGLELEDALGEEGYRREAMGAFTHEIRTPITSIRMVMELARRQSKAGQLLLDTELAKMLNSSVDDLQQLADDLQELSRMERGKVAISPGPCDLGAALEAARGLTGREVEITGEVPAGVEGPWDAPRLVRAIAGFATAGNRIGNGSGKVQFNHGLTPRSMSLTFESGQPVPETKPIAADAGFAFFRSRQLVLAMGGAVVCTRGERYAKIVADLPLRRPSELSADVGAVAE
ncbi:MAG: histidine kinase dimerization/phospho-acceptor domain-containing protein [Anaerolineaceae bacterium]